MKRICFPGWLIRAGLFFTALIQLHAQWTVQTVPLQPGWNSVYLEIQPEPSEAALVFSDLPVESVWMWNRRSSTVQFVQDSNTLLPENPDWLAYFPASAPLAGRATLFSVPGGQTYLIKLHSSASPTNWVVSGRPVIVRKPWATDSLDFTGFSLGRVEGPSFLSFFAGSSAHAGQPIYRMSPSGHWTEVVSPESTPMKSGEAFWIRTQGASDYKGPMEVICPVSSGFDFGRSLVETQLRIRNRGNTARRFQLSPRSSSPPSPGDSQQVGEITLNYWLLDPANNRAGWFPLSSSISSPLLEPGAEWLVRLEVRRPSPKEASSVGKYVGLLDITDQAGSLRVTVPVSALASTGGEAARFGPLAATTASLRPGLWIGSAVVNQVGEAASSAPQVPTATASEFQIRLLIHADDSGAAHLLQKALVMWKPGSTKLNAEGFNEVDVPGRYVIVTDEALTSQFTGAALRDGEAVPRRYSSTAFGVGMNLKMTGSFGGTLRCTNVLGYDDPLNPFKHKYHPDHDNFDENTPPRKQPSGIESFDIERIITLQFTTEDPHHLALAGWGDTQTGGIYLETLVGLHQRPLTVSGAFRLQLACPIGVLNDGL